MRMPALNPDKIDFERLSELGLWSMPTGSEYMKSVPRFFIGRTNVLVKCNVISSEMGHPDYMRYAAD